MGAGQATKLTQSIPGRRDFVSGSGAFLSMNHRNDFESVIFKVEDKFVLKKL